MAMDLAPFNIRVNCVCPGTILTRASEEHMARVGMTKEEFIAAEAPKHLLNRVGHPRECAYPILFLASDEASFITGTHLMVDGGYTTVRAGALRVRRWWPDTECKKKTRNKIRKTAGVDACGPSSRYMYGSCEAITGDSRACQFTERISSA